MVANRPCIVVGGGPVAARKVEHLLAAGADVTVIAPSITPALDKLAREGALKHAPRRYEPGDLAGASLGFAATNDPPVNAAILREARTLGILVCAVDEHWPEGDFITPAVSRQGEITVAVSGASPERLKELRRRIDELLAADP